MDDEIAQLKDFSQSLINHIKEEKDKPKQYVKEVTVKINKFQEQITKHFEHQQTENDKMQKEITDLKGDKTSIEQDLIGRLLLSSYYRVAEFLGAENRRRYAKTGRPN